MTLAVNVPQKMAITRSVIAIFFVFAIFGCDRQIDYRWQGNTMGTTYSIIAVDVHKGLDHDVMQASIDGVLDQVNQEMSTYLHDSELSGINKSRADEWIPVSANLWQLLAKAQEIHGKTQGVYDVTIGPLVNLWGFGPDSALEDKIPSVTAIADARKIVDATKIELRSDPSVLRKGVPDLYIDLSSIAKGHGVDRVGALLEKNGVANYLVEIGGELLAKGHSSRGDRWKIAVEKPQAGNVAVQRVLGVDGYGVATSGDYRNYFEKDGVRYSHTIDAKSGYPVTHKLASVTVVAENAASADGWATALFVLGEKEGLKVANREELAAYFIYKSDEGFAVIESDAFARMFSEGNKL